MAFALITSCLLFYVAGYLFSSSVVCSLTSVLCLLFSVCCHCEYHFILSTEAISSFCFSVLISNFQISQFRLTSTACCCGLRVASYEFSVYYPLSSLRYTLYSLRLTLLRSTLIALLSALSASFLLFLFHHKQQHLLVHFQRQWFQHQLQHSLQSLFHRG